MVARPVAVVVVAGGPGKRLGADLPKALVALAGEPILLHCLRAIDNAAAADPRSCDEVVVVAPMAHVADVVETLAQRSSRQPWRWPTQVVAGGRERQDSVLLGVGACSSAATVVIHDTARPFLPAPVLRRVIDAAATHGAAIAALAAVDTVKLVDADRRIESTPPRTRVWMAQTPQAFRRELLLAAHAAAVDNSATDDAALVEAYGHPVDVVEGDTSLRKITTAEDVRWAQWMLDSGQWPR